MYLAHLTPDANAIDVWTAQRRDARSAWLALLDNGELKRYSAFLWDEDQARFLVGCALVRAALGHRLNVAPEQIVLDRSCPSCGRPHGRVRLVRPEADIHVSVSHAGVWILVAVHVGAPVGVDVEQVDPRVDISGLAKLVLAPAEAAGLSATDPMVRPAAFTQIWCRKEAVVKVTGDGLRHRLANIVVADPHQPARLPHWDARPDLVEVMRLHDLPVDRFHRACIAYIALATLPVKTLQATDILAKLG